MATTRISDVIVPEIFSPYVQELTQEKSRLVQSGALVMDGDLSALLGGGGLTFNQPFFKDLANDADNVSTDDPDEHSTPNKIGADKEVQVRLSRNNSWSTMDLTSALAGADPAEAIAQRVAAYWTRRLQQAFIATVNGVFAQNALANPVNATQNDMTHDISGSVYADGVTNFSAEAFIDAALTMGDSMDDLTLVTMHSIVYARALKNNLIDFIPDSSNTGSSPDANPGRGRGIPTFLGRLVVVDDGVPFTGGVFDTWIFGTGAVQGGANTPKVPTETERLPSAGKGAGQEVLYDRHEWILHPVGHAYVGTPPNGGPSNANTANNLANSASWNRVFPERKQIRIARLKTREF